MSRRRKRSRPAQPQQQAQDAYINTLNRTGLAQPNWMNAIAYPETRTTQMYQLWNGLYRDSWIPAAIVDIPAEDMLKSWVTITTELAPEDMDQLDRAIRITQTKSKLLEGLKWGRLYGGAAGLIMLEGEDTPEALAQPLDLSRVRLGGYKGIRIFDRYIGVFPSVELVEDISSPDFGLPKYYNLTGQTGIGNGIRVHYSRILRFTGADVPELERIAEQYWGISVLERVIGELAKRDNTSANVAGLVERANVLIRKIKNFNSKMATMSDGSRENVYQTLYAQNQTLNNFSTLAIADGDDATNLQYSFAGIADVYELFMLDIAGAAKIPASKLYGRSPAGLNATGESDLQNYYDSIAQEQEAHLRPVLDKLLPVIATSTWGFVPDDLDFTFNSPRSASEEQKATIATGIAGQIAQLVNAGVVSPKQALKELKAAADITGRWTNITDEEIEAADDMAGVPGEDLSAISQLLGGTTTASDAEWEESKHPRDDDGKFSSGGGGGGSSSKKLTQSDVANTAEENRERAEREGLGEVGKSSPNGEMKTVTLWHGSFADFDKFDYSKSQKRGSDLQGAGHYFTDDPEKASQFGDILYKVEVKYSTDRRTAKKTGREKDFQYDPETGYWVIPQSKEGNIKILAKGKTEYQGAGHGVKVI